MIVCSLPRCGATKFCLELSEAVGLPFVGEMHAIHINSDEKAKAHETGFQPSFTPDAFADLVHNHTDKIVLVNQHPYLMLPQADRIILRKDMSKAFLSLANFLMKMYPGIPTQAIIHQLRVMKNDHDAVTSCLDKYPRDVVWYEDYFGDLPTLTPLLDEHPHRKLITGEIESYGTQNR